MYFLLMFKLNFFFLYSKTLLIYFRILSLLLFNMFCNILFLFNNKNLVKYYIFYVMFVVN